MPSPLKSTLLFLETLTIEKSVSIQTILKISRGQGSFCLFFILSLPFCLPITLPGMSTPFGLVIAAVAFRRLFKKPFLIPERFYLYRIRSTQLKKILRFGFKVESFLAKWSRPRFLFSFYKTYGSKLAILLILLCGLILALPLPIPFSNFLFAWVICLLSIGHLMNDALFFILGFSLFLSICSFLLYLTL